MECLTITHMRRCSALPGMQTSQPLWVLRYEEMGVEFDATPVAFQHAARANW